MRSISRPGRQRLNAMTLEAGGRVYLAKDAFAEPGQMDAMFPERGQWAELVNRLDPDRDFATDLVRRLALRDVT